MADHETPDPETMRQAFERRDRAADGQFVACVTTTGIYCRASCPARRPKPEHVLFMANAHEARAAGFRPCRRCHPDDVAPDEQAVAQVLAMTARAGGPVSLAVLAAATGYSSSHLQRVFKRAIGLSPAAWGRALRVKAAQDRLTAKGELAGAIYDAGYSGPSRFYAEMEGRLGMTPSAWSKGGAGATIHYAVVESSFGPMLVAATAKGICRLSFGETAEDLAARFPSAQLSQGGAPFAALLKQVVDAVETPGAAHQIPLDVRGTAFQEAVWQALRAIPSGQTRTYAEIAAAAGNPRAVRAAGSANGANPVAVLVPCHRVVRSDGSLGGYAYGEDIKRRLLEREGEKGP